MLIMDADSALREHIDGTEPDTVDQLLSRKAARKRPETGVDGIHIVRSEPAEAEPSAELPSTATPEDALAPARGIALGVAIGLCCWALIAGLIRTVFF